MVRDGIYYGAALAFLAAFAGYWGGWFWAAPFGLLAAFVLYFFRDPERDAPAGSAPVSPADGRVVELRQVDLRSGTMWKISIFLSIFNVHVNRSPIAGVVRQRSYQPGRFRVASVPEASVVNEQSTLEIAGEHTVVVKQIAGAIARRIVCTKQVGDRVERGERIGLIKFGSRVDLFLPLNYKPCIRVGDRVKAGRSIVADVAADPALAARQAGTALSLSPPVAG